jgi:hypothetical protein
MVVAVSRQRSYSECSSSDFRSPPQLRWALEAERAEVEAVEPGAARAEAEPAAVEPVAVEPVAVELVAVELVAVELVAVELVVEPVAAEPEAVQAELEPVAAEAARERVVAASTGRSNRSPIAPKRLRTTSRRALPAWSGAPRSTSACSATAAFFPMRK